MVITKSLRYFILAGLIVTLPTHPMGWFNSTWKKVGVGIAVMAALVGIAYGIKWHQKYRQEEYGLKTEVLPWPPNLSPQATVNEVIFHTVKSMLDHGVDHNYRPNAHTFYVIDGQHEGFCLLPITETGNAGNLLERGTLASSVVTRIIDAHGQQEAVRLDIPGKNHNNPYKEFTEIPGLIELIQKHTYEKNKQSISQEIHDRPQEIEQFPKGITDIVGAYGAEYPLIREQPLPAEETA